MRPLLTLFACFILLVSAWGSAARAANGLECGETADQMAMHVAGGCDEAPANADKDYLHCHDGCHGHHVVAPIMGCAPARSSDIRSAYPAYPQVKLAAHQVDQTLRPPQA